MQEKFLIPISLLLSAVIIGSGIYFTNLSNQKEKKINKEENDVTLNIKTVDVETEHLQGSKTADIFIIEYSDLECIGCKIFSKLEDELVEKYKDNPRVAFVFRHFPLYKTTGNSKPLHPSSGVEAMATECVAKLSTEENFFKMKKRIFETTKSDGNYPLDKLPSLAVELGINELEFNECISSTEIQTKIEGAWQEAVDSKIKTTPSIFIQIKPAQQTFEAIPGKDIIDNAIQAYLQNN